LLHLRDIALSRQSLFLFHETLTDIPS
jgi:hypothetical protein